MAHYSSITTFRERQFATIIVFDGKTGDLTDYPDHVTQTLIRQTVNALAINDPNIKSKILDSLSQISHQGNDKTTLIDIAETIILSQLFRTLSFPPSEYMDCVQTTSLPKSIRENYLINGILGIKDPHEKQVLIDTFEDCGELKGGKLSVSRDFRFNSPNFRQIVMKNNYLIITINYNIGGLWTLKSIRRTSSFIDLGNILIDPKYYEDALKRFNEGGLWIASFYYNIKIEVAKSKLHLFLSILNIRPWSNTFLQYLSLLDYIIDRIDYTVFGSIKFPDVYERERMDNKFVMDTLKMLRERLDKNSNI